MGTAASAVRLPRVFRAAAFGGIQRLSLNCTCRRSARTCDTSLPRRFLFHQDSASLTEPVEHVFQLGFLQALTSAGVAAQESVLHKVSIQVVPSFPPHR